MIRHIVLLRWKRDIDDAQKRAVREAIEGLRSVPEVRALQAGDNVGRSPFAYDFAAVLDFEDNEAFLRYLASEPHLRYVEGPGRDAVDSIAAIQHAW